MSVEDPQEPQAPKSFVTPTNVVNLVVGLIMFLAVRNHAAISQDMAAGAALFVWSVINMCTSKGGRGAMSATVLVNGVVALLSVISVFLHWKISPDEMEIFVTAFGGANLLGTEGSVTDVALINRRRKAAIGPDADA